MVAVGPVVAVGRVVVVVADPPGWVPPVDGRVVSVVAGRPVAWVVPVGASVVLVPGAVVDGAGPLSGASPSRTGPARWRSRPPTSKRPSTPSWATCSPTPRTARPSPSLVEPGPGGGTSLVVEDAGSGFDADALERGRSGGGSTGLGLDIARRTAEVAGGRIGVGPASLGGARITLEFPAPAA